MPVRARIYTVGGLSAHADQAALLDWLRGFQQAPGRTFIVHGEATAAGNFASAIRERLGWSAVHLPQLGEWIDI